eukprot:365220-Chlamydomonas_euryale.AAC.3
MKLTRNEQFNFWSTNWCTQDVLTEVVPSWAVSMRGARLSMAAMIRARIGVLFTGFPPVRMACNTFTPSQAVGTASGLPCSQSQQA